MEICMGSFTLIKHLMDCFFLKIPAQRLDKVDNFAFKRGDLPQ